ncbi:MAG: DNA polymerase III subunit delta [Patescibacteria group bacterium]
MFLFFYGEETYISSQNIKQLKKRFLEKNPTGGGLVEFDCDSECNIEKISNSFGEQNLFAEKKLIIIKNFFANTKAPEQKELVETMKREIDDVVVFVEEGKVRKNTTLFKWLVEKSAKTQENNTLEEKQLENWIAEEVKTIGGKIEKDAIEKLILFIGNDLWRLTGEIQKLVCYKKNKNIIAEDVEKIVHGKIDSNMFEMIEAIGFKDKGKAIMLLNKQISAGEEIFHIFGMYAYQVRTLLSVGSMMEEGSGDKNVIAKTVKLHPFVVQKSMTMVRNLSFEKVKKMHKDLTQMDFDIKQGNCDAETAMNLFVVS